MSYWRKLSKLHVSVTSRILLVFSVVCLAASAGMAYSCGGQIYFAIFHRPLHVFLAKPTATYKRPQLPHFDVLTLPVASTIEAGASQTVTLTMTADRDVDAGVLVWVKSPANKQIFRSPSHTNVHFTKGVSQNFSYTVMSTTIMPKGVYKVSGIVSSADRQSDYYVNYDFAEYTIL